MTDRSEPPDLRGFVALALLHTQLRAGTAARVVRAFGDPRRALGPGHEEFAALRPLASAEAAALEAFAEWEAVARELERCRAASYTLLALGHAGYPAQLEPIADPPALLYVRGTLLPEDRRALAIVGSRHASRYGIGAARGFAKHLARAGVTIVSGLARGVDQAAHEGALEAEGRTIAVLGCGLDFDYPRGARALRDRIAASGALVSEFPLDAEPFKHHFPVRNRIVSALALGVLVAEASRDSGSLITARAALDQGREVFAVPGPIDSAGSIGTLDLIRQGARAVGSPAHVLEDLGLDGATPPLPLDDTARGDATPLGPRRLSARETAARQLLAAIALTPVTFEALVARTGLDSAAASAVILDLELDGLVARASDGTYTANDPFAPP